MGPLEMAPIAGFFVVSTTKRPKMPPKSYTAVRAGLFLILGEIWVEGRPGTQPLPPEGRRAGGVFLAFPPPNFAPNISNLGCRTAV